MAARKHRKYTKARLVEKDDHEFNEILTKAFSLNQEGKTEQALEILESAPPRLKTNPDFLYLRGSTYFTAGDLFSALDDLETTLRFKPDYFIAYGNLALTYASIDFPRHAWRAAERFLRYFSQLEEDDKDIYQKIIHLSKAYYHELANDLKISFEKIQEAAIYHERAQIYLNKGDYSATAREAKQALRLVPHWSSPRNNLSLALYYEGKVQEAIREGMANLQTYPDDIHALSNLTTYHYMLLEGEKATPYVERLIEIVRSSPPYSTNETNFIKIITALAYAEADQVLSELATQMIKLPFDELESSIWRFLGVAAANYGQLDIAERLIKRAIKMGSDYPELEENALEVIKKARKNPKHQIVTPSGANRIPYFHYNELWTKAAFDYLFSTTTKNKPDTDIYPDLKRVILRYPYLVGLSKYILYYEDQDEPRQIAIDILAASEIPGAILTLKEFASSQVGSDKSRMNAIAALQKVGEIKKDETILFWSQKIGNWKHIRQFKTKIVAPPQLVGKPEALELVDQSKIALNSSAKTAKEKSIQYLKKAIEIDPQCAVALHNLGVLYIQSERREEGEQLIRKAVEVDPNYLFGKVTLASVELYNNNTEVCKNIITSIITSPEIPENVMMNALGVQIQLALLENEPAMAENLLETLKSYHPDAAMLEDLENMVLLASIPSKMHKRWLENTRRYHQRQLNQPINANEGLAACLDRLSRESLSATLEAWRLPTQGRKKEVIDKLSHAITNRKYLELILTQNLEEKDRAALKWLIEGDGARPWKEFTSRFGDDIEDSPYWRYNKPKTIAGRLRLLGLVAVGRMEKSPVAMIPLELRPLLLEFLSKSIEGPKHFT